MDVVLSFDTEDYITPQAADAQKWWADELHERSIRASFQCAGELIRVLEQRGRADVIASLARHEIGNHTNYHSLPPTHPEALEGMPLDQAVAWVIRHEAEGFATLERAFGRVPASYCAPGMSWTPATLLAFAAMGTRVFCNDKLPGGSGSPYWYCGMLTLPYHMALENYFARADRTVDDFMAAFETKVTALPDDGVLAVMSHPTTLVTRQFWDHNFFDAARPPREQWRTPPLRSAEEVQAHKDFIRRCLDRISGRGDVRFVDYATVWSERSGMQRRDLAALLAECGLRSGEEGRLPLRSLPADGYLSPDRFDNFIYRWPVFPKGFIGRSLIEQARGLGWTAAPSMWRHEERVTKWQGEGVTR